MNPRSAREILPAQRACASGETCYLSPPNAMPNYDYECRKCGKRFEVFQSMNAAKLTDCPEDACDGEVKRLLGTGGGILFKGSGFYQTDYRSSSYQAAAKADSAPAKTEGAPAKSDSKPAPAASKAAE
jgi:putative FmdB family regulatory protein